MESNECFFKDFLKREPICLNKIEEAKANYEDAKEKLKKKETQLNKQIGDVQNHFMLLKLFELEQRRDGNMVNKVITKSF